MSVPLDDSSTSEEDEEQETEYALPDGTIVKVCFDKNHFHCLKTDFLLLTLPLFNVSKMFCLACEARLIAVRAPTPES